jgi:glycosyltransferase involved in cell wall biosynthesis
MGNTATSLRVVLLTTNYHPILGGVETHARQLAVELQRRSFDVTVLTKRLESSVPAVETIDGVHVQRVPPAGPRSRLAKWQFMPFAFASLVRMRPGPDLIFCPDFRGVGVAAICAGLVRRCTVILQAGTPGALSCDSWDPDLTRWGIDPRGWLGRALKWPMQRIYASASGYTCISREIEAEALGAGVPAERLAYVPHGVDIARFRPANPLERAAARKAAGLADGTRIVLFVGRLSKEKGVLDLVHAWAQLRPPGAMLVLVGPDMTGHPLDAGAEAREIVARHRLGDSVRFAGPTDDPAEILRTADVFVQPSHYEAFGISVIEAMASGIATVATNVGGMRDFLVAEENALLCEPHDVEGLASQLERALGDDNLRQRLAERGRAKAVALFDKDVVSDAYARVFRQFAEQERNG